MRRFVLVPMAAAALVAAAACAPKPGATAGSAPKRLKLERLPADAVLWEGELPEGVERSALLEKDGVLSRTKEPAADEDTVRWWPYSLDYWGLTRTDLETLLDPHVGRTVRVTGHFKKIYSDGAWIYEVDPVKITALADKPPG